MDLREILENARRYGVHPAYLLPRLNKGPARPPSSAGIVAKPKAPGEPPSWIGPGLPRPRFDLGGRPRSPIEDALDNLSTGRGPWPGAPRRYPAILNVSEEAPGGGVQMRQLRASTEARQPSLFGEIGAGAERFGRQVLQGAGRLASDIPRALHTAEQTDRWFEQETAKQAPGVGPRMHPGMSLEARLQAGSPPQDPKLRGPLDPDPPPPKWKPPVRGRDAYEGAQLQDFQGNETWRWPLDEHYAINEKRYPQASGKFGKGVRRNADGTRRDHDGVDVAAPIRTPIYADRDGFVNVYGNAKSKSGYGLWIQLAPDQRTAPETYSLFGHLSEVAPGVEGRYVRRGELIGYSGKSGNADRDGIDPHLHYEIREDGEYQNPYEHYRFGRGSPGYARR